MARAESQLKFQALVEDHRKILYKVCNSYCRNPDDRDDLAQEIVIRLWQSFDSFDGRVRFSTWMYRVALNVAISFYRRERTRSQYALPAGERFLETIAGSESEPDEVRLLYQFIETLDELNKSLILLYLDGHSHAEIGQVLGISESNAGTRIGRLKKTMREAFSGAKNGAWRTQTEVAGTRSKARDQHSPQSQLLRDAYTRKARFALWRLAAMLAAGSAILLGIIIWLGAFIHQNRGMPEFVWPAVALDVFAIATLACLNLQTALALQVKYDQPVAVIQKQLERLRKIRIRYIQGVCLGTTLTWAPIFMVVMKVALGVDVWRTFDRTWLVTNVLVGLGVIPVGIWLARKLGGRLNQRFLNELAGYNLSAASRFLAELARFEEEEPQA